MEPIEKQGCIENYSLWCNILSNTWFWGWRLDTKNWIDFTGTHYHSIDIRFFHLATTGFWVLSNQIHCSFSVCTSFHPAQTKYVNGNLQWHVLVFGREENQRTWRKTHQTSQSRETERFQSLKLLNLVFVLFLPFTNMLTKHQSILGKEAQESQTR